MLEVGRRRRFLGRVARLLISFTLVSAWSNSGAFCQEETLSQEEPIRVDVNLVTLRFSVRDAEGSFLKSLGGGNFRVMENGRKCEIAYFQRPRSATQAMETLWLAFLLDVSGSTFATRNEEILAARTFFENIGDFTHVGVFGFTDQLITFEDFTDDRALALEAFSAAQSHLGKTAIYHSIDALIARMEQVAGPTDSKAIIVVSDAMDDNYRRSPSTAARARMANIVLYSIWVPSAAHLYIGPAAGSGKRWADPKTKRIKAAKEEAFASVSSQTGGRHFGGFEAILDFDGVLAEINDEIFGNLYSIGYYTDDPYLERQERNILVATDRPDARVSGLFKDIPDQDRAKQEIIAALFDSNSLEKLPEGELVPFREIGVELDLLRPRVEQSKSVLPFRLKISSWSLQKTKNGDLNTQFGVIAVLSDPEGNDSVQIREIFRARIAAREIQESGRGVIYTNRLAAPLGRYMLRLAVIEIPTWRMTVIERPIRILEASGS